MAGLAEIPFFGAYAQRTAMNQQQPMQQLQQAQAAMGLQGALQQQATARQRQADLAALGPNPTPDALMDVVARYNPEKAAELQMKADEQKEARASRLFQFAQTLDLRQQALDQQKELALQRSQDAKERQTFEQQYKQQSLVLQQQNSALNAELKKMGLEIQRQGQQLQLQKFDAEKAAREDREIEGQIGKTADRLKDIQPVWTAAQQLNALISNYTPDTIPGVGYAKNTDIGKALLTEEGKNVASSIKLFGNSLLKAMSGAAVTPPEEIRQMAASMADGRFSAKDFYIAWPKMAAWVNDQMAVGTAGLTPKAKERFLERTGLKLDPLKPRFNFKDGKLQDAMSPQQDGGEIGGGPARIRFDAQGNRI